MKVCFYLKKQEGFYATYSTIRFSVGGKKLKIPIVVDYYEDLEIYPAYDYIVHCESGILFKDINHFINKLQAVDKTKIIYQKDYPDDIYSKFDSKMPDQFINYNKNTENALWVLNNHPEQIKFWKFPQFVAPASGTMWMLQMINPIVEDIKLYDISKIQVLFAKKLLDEWDGKNYGKFTIDFIKTHNLKNIHICQSFDSKDEYYKTIADHINLEHIINNRFFNVMPHNFADLWQQNRKSKHVEISNGNILHHISPHDDFVWCRGNCINYKYTLLNTEDNLLDSFSTLQRIFNASGNYYI